MAISEGKQRNSHSNSRQQDYLISDNELASLTAGNDMNSFEELYRRHYRRVYCICLKMIHNMSDAEDLAHDVFIQLQRNIASFRGESSFVSWLHRITVNTVLMRFRKKSHRCELTTAEGEMPEVVAPDSDHPSQNPIINNIALSTAIAKLPKGYRNVFLLHDVEGYEHEEIGQILGISSGTSKSQLHKARLKLRTLLQETVGQSAVTEQPAKDNVVNLFASEISQHNELLAA